MKLVLAKIKHGFDDVIPVAQPDVPDSEKAKLLVHRIPQDLPSEELCQVICGDFTIEIQASKKGRGDKYSAFAVFKSPQEALNAYENLQGLEDKDNIGRPQKLVSVQLKSGLTSTIYVRKMTADYSPPQVPAKRTALTNKSECVPEPKRLKTDQNSEVSERNSCTDPEEEIKRLKKLLNQRDEEISSLQNSVALTRKQRL